MDHDLDHGPGPGAGRSAIGEADLVKYFRSKWIIGVLGALILTIGALVHWHVSLALGVSITAFLMLLGASLVAVHLDRQTVKELAARLVESEERYRALVENSTDLVTLHRPGARAFFVSASFEPLLGRGAAEILKTAPMSLVHPDDVGTTREMIERFAAEKADDMVACIRLRRMDGEYRWFEFQVKRIVDAHGKLLHYQSAARDITERRKLEARLAEQAEELRQLSLRDALTGLYNRRGFLELAAHALRVAQRDRRRATLLFMDLDGLKRINDRLGHEAGDRAIAEAAQLLRSTCRASDIVARLGGDEFVVFVPNVDASQLESIKLRLDHAVQTANAAPGRAFALAFSTGSTRFDPAQPVPIEALLAEADASMYQVKAERKRAEAKEREAGPPVY